MEKRLFSDEAMQDARDSLAAAFPAEYAALDRDSAYLVYQDYMLAFDEDGIGAREYARRIGRGNLASYVACLHVGAQRRGER